MLLAQRSSLQEGLLAAHVSLSLLLPSPSHSPLLAFPPSSFSLPLSSSSLPFSLARALPLSLPLIPCPHSSSTPTVQSSRFPTLFHHPPLPRPQSSLPLLLHPPPPRSPPQVRKQDFLERAARLFNPTPTLFSFFAGNFTVSPAAATHPAVSMLIGSLQALVSRCA